MRYIRKFNESKNDNVELIKDVVTDFLDEFDIESIDTRQTVISNSCISETIIKTEHQIITPAFIRSVRENDNYHNQFKGSKKYDDDVSLVKKYLKYKSILVSIKSRDDNAKVISKLKSCIGVIESYGLIHIISEKHRNTIYLVFVHE